MERPAAPSQDAPAPGENLDAYGKSGETSPSAEARQIGPWDLKRIALHIAKDCDGPCLVRFVNTATVDLKTPEGKAARSAVMNSASLLAIWESNDRTGDPEACALTKYCFKGRFSMEVSGVSKEACAAVHRANAPALVVLGAKTPGTQERACVKILEGRILPAMAVAAMQEALRGVDFGRMAQDIQQFDKGVMAVESLQNQIKTKQGMLDRAGKNPAKASQLQAQIEDLRKDLEKAEARLEALKARFVGVG